MGKNGLYHKTKRRKEKELEKRNGHKGEEVDGISVEDVIVGVGNQEEKGAREGEASGGQEPGLGEEMIRIDLLGDWDWDWKSVAVIEIHWQRKRT